MSSHLTSLLPLAFLVVAALFALSAGGDEPSHAHGEADLTHEQALRWVNDHHAWRLARKTKPIWARPVTLEEIGKEFRTADRTVDRAREGQWLCVGSANEPWFQKPAKIQEKYVEAGELSQRFEFDAKPHTYTKFTPKENVLNWVAQVKGPGIQGFHIKPGYDRDSAPLHSRAGGYIVKDHCADPYHDKVDDVWLVQQSLFESTYELLPDQQSQQQQ
jgi:hypothetical protein